MSHTHFYEVDVLWKKDRIGDLSSPVLKQSIECATPPEFPAGVEGIWSPEHLYAAAINSCYMATFLAIAHNFKLSFTAFNCKTICKLTMVDGKYEITSAEILPMVSLTQLDLDSEKALKVLEKSKSACLVTNSIKTSITLRPSLV